jgi:hypothetical protein
MHVLKIFISVLIISVLASCGGGGGGGAGSDGSELVQSTRTAVRLLHGSIDASPIELWVGNEPEAYSQKARFAQGRFYVAVDDGQTALKLQRANTVGNAVSVFPGPLSKDTEYSILVYGSAKQGTFGTRLITDQTERPDAGKAYFRLVNSLEDSGTLTATILSGSTVGTAAYSMASEFSLITSGVQTFEIYNSKGKLVDATTVTIPDRGELTLLVMGSTDLGVVVSTAYMDLD